jgi:putative transposase
MTEYSSNLSDKEWSIVEVILEESYPPYSLERPKGGRVMWTDMREILNGIFYVAKTGCQWEMLPKDFPPKGTVYDHLSKLKRFGVWNKLLEATNRLVREQEGRALSPSFGLIDSQSTKTIYKGEERGVDGNKKIKGRKRHIVVDVLGCLLAIIVHAANAHDTKAAESVLKQAVENYPSLEAFCGDEGYRGTAVEAAETLKRPMEISKKIIGDEGKEKEWKVIPKRWIVERTFAWWQNFRRLSKDYEVMTDNSETMAKVVALRLNLKKLSIGNIVVVK